MHVNTKESFLSFNSKNRHRWILNISQRIPKGSDVLDAGAGTGRYREFFSHCNYRSQDFCQTPSVEGKYTKMDYVCDITNIPVPDKSFDVIICTEVLEHVPEPIKVIEEFSRILRPGGRLFLSAPMGCGVHQEPYIYYSGFAPYWYEKFLNIYNFEDIKINKNCGFFRFYGQESRRFVRYLFPSDMSLIKKIFTFPLKLIFSLWFAKIIPFSCYYLDRLDKDNRFTVGYFVESQKRS